MCANGRIAAQPLCVKAAERLTEEIEDLTLEIFVTTYGATWDEAYHSALEALAGLIEYADTWDDWIMVMEVQAVAEGQS
jgi:hypothetical protein